MGQRRAFTLLEVIIVMAIIAIVAALAMPMFEVWYADQKVVDAADSIRAEWARARSRAIDDGVPYSYGVAWNQGNWRIGPDGQENLCSGGSSTNGTVTLPDGHTTCIVESGKLPHDIRFSQDGSSDGGSGSPSASAESESVDASSYSTLVTFFPDGSIRCFNPDGSSVDILEVKLQGESTRELVVFLRAITGSTDTKWTTGSN